MKHVGVCFSVLSGKLVTTAAADEEMVIFTSVKPEDGFLFCLLITVAIKDHLITYFK